MTRHIVAAALALVAFAVAAGAASAQTPEKRVALVIGNDAYQTLPGLGNATADARDIGRALETAGFETTVKKDVKRRELYQLIDAFAARIAGSPDTVGLFYYAGHGIQTNGKNYLVPVDAALTSDADLEAEAVDAGKVLSAMDQARNRINIVILDACRDNPLPKGRSLARGLTSMPAPRGTFIGYAAAPGQTAQDGEPGENGVFTGTLIKHLGVPGLQLEEVFKRVIGGVSERTGGKQLPWMESSVQGNFYFLAPRAAGTTPAATPPSPPSADAEIVFWQSIQANAAASDYEEYLRQFPQGRFAGLARNRLAALRSPPAPSVPAPPQTAPGGTCGTGVVAGLDPHGDGFLAVKSGPGLNYQRIDKLYEGEQIYLCTQRGDWLGIVYTRNNQQCNVSGSWRESMAYTGPCRSGWAHGHWIKSTAR